MAKRKTQPTLAEQPTVKYLTIWQNFKDSMNTDGHKNTKKKNKNHEPAQPN